ncbi:MAG: SDR family oxidoreductase [Planctomycetota bacterium]|nr:MAG: SDR family oxidoreductase [Planctomycetota bacterium]
MESIAKAALITGAAKRVGRAIALELADAGFDIAVHFKTSADAARQLCQEIEKRGRRATLVSCELADLEMANNIVSDTIEAFGRIDVLVNNASIFKKTPVDQVDLAQWDRMIRVNMIAPLILARTAARYMQKTGGGSIINLTDIYADFPAPNHDIYCATKAALVSITKSLALELAPNITVNAVAPGIALFPEHYDDKLRAQLVSKVPLKREGSPPEIAALVRFLVTEGKYITGQTIPIDGGRSIAK